MNAVAVIEHEGKTICLSINNLTNFGWKRTLPRSAKILGTYILHDAFPSSNNQIITEKGGEIDD